MARKSTAPSSPASSAAASSSASTGDEDEHIDAPPNPTPKPSTADEDDSSGDAKSSSSSSSSSSESESPAPPRHSTRGADPAVKLLTSKPMAPPPENSAPRHFHRVWTDDAEIAVLDGLLDFKTNTGKVPVSAAEMDPFFDFVHDSLDIEVTRSQLFDKVRRLKKKFEDSRGRLPTKPHDSALYQISRKIWRQHENGTGASGNLTISLTTSNKRRKTDAREEQSKDEGDTGKANGYRYPFLMDAVNRIGDSEPGRVLLMEAIGRIDESRLKKMEAKYKKLKLQQVESDDHRLELMTETIKVITEQW